MYIILAILCFICLIGWSKWNGRTTKYQKERLKIFNKFYEQKEIASTPEDIERIGREYLIEKDKVDNKYNYGG